MSPGEPVRLGRVDLTAAVLCLVPAVMVLGNAALVPALPRIRISLDLSVAQAALLITAFSGVAGIVIPFAGPLSDRWGRRPIIVAALVLYGVGAAVAAAAVLVPGAAWVMLIVGRAIQGVGAAGTQPIAWAVAGDLYRGSGRERVLGLIETANGLSKVVSPVLGALAAAWGWAGPFVMFAVVAWTGAAMAFVFIPRRARRPPPRPGEARAVRRAVLRLLPAVAGAFPAFMALFGLLTYLSEILETRHGLEGAMKGLVLAVPMMASAAVSLGVGLALGPLGHPLRIAATLAMTVEAAGFGLLAVFTRSPWFFIGLVAVGTGNGGLLPALNVMATGVVPERERGLVTALYGTFRFMGVALGPPLFGLLWPLNESLALAATAGLLLAGAATMWLGAPDGPVPASQRR